MTDKEYKSIDLEDLEDRLQGIRDDTRKVEENATEAWRLLR